MAGSPTDTDPRFSEIKTQFPSATLVSLTHDLPTYRLGFVLSADDTTATRPPASYMPPRDRRRAVHDWAAREYRSLRLEAMLRVGLVEPALTSAVSERDRQAVRGFAWLIVATLAAAADDTNLGSTVWTSILGTLARAAADHVAWADGLIKENAVVTACRHLQVPVSSTLKHDQPHQHFS